MYEYNYNPTQRPRRRHFVAEGEVPVVRLQGQPATPEVVTSRRQAAEAAVAALRKSQEQQAQLERLVGDLRASLLSTQTKLGHAELAAREAQRSAEAERNRTASLLATLSEAQARIEVLEAAASAARRVIATEPAPERVRRASAPSSVRARVAAADKPVKWWAPISPKDRW